LITFDGGVLPQAVMSRSEHHELGTTRAEEVVGSGNPFGVSDLVLAAVVRIATDPGVFKPAMYQPASGA
jgi:hypothetical protein